MDVEKIAKKARKSISKFCSEECRSYCCRKGYLVLTPSQADLVTQKKKKEYEDKKLLKGIKEGRNHKKGKRRKVCCVGTKNTIRKRC